MLDEFIDYIFFFFFLKSYDLSAKNSWKQQIVT